MLYHSAVVRRFHFDSFDGSVAELVRESPYLAAQGIPTRAVHAVHADSGRVSLGTQHRGTDGTLLSHDQVLAHGILAQWVDRAMSDPDISLGLDGAKLAEHVGGLLNRIHAVYRKILCLNLSEKLGPFVSDKMPGWNDGGWKTVRPRGFRAPRGVEKRPAAGCSGR